MRDIDPETGHYFDDTKRFVDGSSLTEADKTKIFSANAPRVFSSLKV